MKPIKKITCPNCQKFELRKIQDPASIRKQTIYAGISQGFIWSCPKCVYYFPDKWFDTYFQYEKFVER